MKTLEHFNSFVKEITASTKRTYKQEVLKKYADDLIVRRYLQIAFDPYLIFGISTKKLNKVISGETPSELDNNVFSLFDYLETHNTGTLNEIRLCQQILKKAQETDSELAQLLAALICKDVSIGCNAKTINKEIPGCIRTFSVQLANKYFDKPSWVDGKTFALTTKIDGGRIIAIKKNGKVSFFTRAGQNYEGLVDLEKEMSALMPDNTCLDGEITLLDKGNLCSKEQYKETMKIVRTKEEEKHGIKMLVFDWMPAEDFKSQSCNKTYLKRREAVQTIFDSNNFKYFELLPILYVGDDKNKITELHARQTAKGEEGIMINICDAPYKFTRTSDLLKVKTFNSSDLQIIGFEEGTGKYVGKLGAFICEYKGGQVKVGSGLTDSLRDDIWKCQSQYLNTIIEISYFEETVDSNGKPSLRFPTFKDFRPDKCEPNY